MRIQKLVTFLFIVLLSTACTKEDTLMPPSPDDPGADRYKTTCRSLSESEIEQLGVQHNAILSEVHSNLNFNASNFSQEVEGRFMAVQVDGLGNADKDYTMNLNLDFEKQLEKLDNYTLVKSYTDQVNYAIQNAPDLSSMSTQFASIESQARSNLSCGELEVVLTMISVSANSAEFWLPESEGGTGEGQAMLAKASGGANKVSDTTRDVIAADGMAASGACIEFAVVAAFGGPAGAGALFGGILFAAAWSSGTAALLS